MNDVTLESIEFYYKSMLALMPGNVYWKDKNGILQGCNNNLAKTLNLASPEDIIGKTDYDIATKKEADAIKKIDQEVMTKGVEQTNEEPYTLPDGTNVIYLTQRSPVFNKQREVVGIIGISLDITERKKIEKDLQVAKEKAESANYIMTEFISNMGHDLATPISDVISIAHMLHSYVDEYPELKEYFQLFMTRSEDCEKVRKRIINATSISNLEVKAEKFPISLELLALEMALRPTIGSKNLKLIIHPLKPKKEEQIETDRTKFHDILFDLMSNAINFTEEGQVTVSVLKEGDFFHIRIADTGIGIPSDKFEYIFQQYTKLSRSNRHGANFKGVGAGLYLARIRASILNASISVESEVNKGSVFTLVIPAHPVKNDPVP